MGNTTEKTDTLPGEAGSELAGLGEEVREALNTIDFVTPSEVNSLRSEIAQRREL